MEARGDDPAAFGDAHEAHGELLSRTIAPSLAPAAPSVSGPEWFVSIDGTPAGPLSTDAVVSRISTGVVDWDAHVWREGYGAWKTVGDSDTLVRAVASARHAVPDSSDSTERTVLPSDADDQPTVARGIDDDAPTHATLDDAPTHATLDDSPTRIAYEESPTRMFSHSAPPGALQPIARTAFASRPPGSLSPVSAPRAQAQQGYEQHGIAPLPPITSQHVFSAAAQSLPITSEAAWNAPASVRPGFASGEGSGIIDIRALASLAQQSHIKAPPTHSAHAASLRPPPRAPGAQAAAPALQQTYQMPERNDPADPFASMGTNHGIAFAALDSIAPVSRKAPQKDSTVTFAILAGAGMIAAAAFAAVYLTRTPTGAAIAPVVAASQPVQPIAAAAEPIAQPSAALPAEPAVAQEPAAALPTEAAPSEPSAAAEPAAAEPEPELAQADAPSEAAAAKGRVAQAGRGVAKPRAGQKARGAANAKTAAEGSDDLAEAETKPAAPPSIDDVLLADSSAKSDAKADKAENAEKTTEKTEDIDDLLAAPAAKPKAASSAPRSIDDLLDGAVDKPDSPAAKPALTEAPSRDDVLSAMRGIESEVRACAASEAEPVTGTASVSITVVGATGKVKSAEVTGIQGSVGSCIARVARKASFSPFSRDKFSVTYPYRFK